MNDNKNTCSRRTFLLTTATVAAGTVLGAPAIVRAAGEKQFHIRVSSAGNTDDYSEHYNWYKHFAESLKNRAGERIVLDFYPNGQLGKEADVVQQIKTSTVDVQITGSPYWEVVVPELAMFDVGYLFDNLGHLRQNLAGNVGKQLSKMVLERSKVTVLGWTCAFGARNIYTKEPVKKLADLDGKKIRVLPVLPFIQTIEAMGAIATPVAFNELYMALQTGVVDGFEQGEAMVISMKFYETTKYCFLSGHIIQPLIIAASPRIMATIPADLKPALLAAAEDANAYQYDTTPVIVKKAADDLVKMGVTFTPMDPAERKEIRQKMARSIWAPFIEKYPLAKPLIDEIDSNRA